MDSPPLWGPLDSGLGALEAQLSPEGSFTATALSYGAHSQERQTLDVGRGIGWVAGMGQGLTSQGPGSP